MQEACGEGQLVGQPTPASARWVTESLHHWHKQSFIQPHCHFGQVEVHVNEQTEKESAFGEIGRKGGRCNATSSAG